MNGRGPLSLLASFPCDSLPLLRPRAGTAVAVTPERLRGSASHFLGRAEPRLFAFAFALDCKAPAAAAAQPYCLRPPRELLEGAYGALAAAPEGTPFVLWA